MPLTPLNVAAAITPALAAAGGAGQGAPQFANGLAIGICMWVPQITVSTVDTGTLGVGAGSAPLLVGSETLGLNMLAGFASFNMIGTMGPTIATGLANGLALAFGQGLVVTTHPSVGVGSAVAKFFAPPAAPVLVAGFAAAALNGQSLTQLAGAIGQALDVTFASLVMPIPVVGAASPTAGGGSGVGKIT